MTKRVTVLASILALLIAGAFGFLAGRGVGPPGPSAPARPGRYHCPRHPAETSDQPGNCPICSSPLVPAGPPLRSQRQVLFYRSPMDPKVQSKTPAQDSMGMDYVPVYADELENAGPSVAGRAVVTLPAETGRLLGLKSEPVAEANLVREIRTVGRVAVDERRVRRVFAKYEGYVERMFVDFTGRPVQKGEPLLRLYSPELLAAQQEYLLARQASRQLAESGVPGLAAEAEALLRAARRRLSLLDMPEAEIARLDATGEARRSLELYSSATGVVTQKLVAEGSRVSPAEPLFEITDLARVWVLADLYERDVATVVTGAKAAVSTNQLPGRIFPAVVAFIAPAVEAATRTVKVRLELDNGGGLLKPDTFVDVVLQSALGRGLVVPEGAVLDSGLRKLVFIDLGDARYAPREITVGARVAGGYAVLAGLRAGERVVSSANFLLDSESSLRAALARSGQ